jgi:nucleoside-diphosphate-sugar epimerase
MNVFIAGGSGAIGFPLVRALVAAGHRVVATTRTPEKQMMIRSSARRRSSTRSTRRHSEWRREPPNLHT